MATERVAWIDIAKGVAMAAVVLGHTYLGDVPVHPFVYSFHVPLFFILAGCTFRVKPMRDMAHASVRRLLLPYLVLCLITALYCIAMGWLRSDGVIGFLGGVVFASGDTDLPFNMYSVGMLWFLMALFVGRLLYNALLGALERAGAHPVVQFALFAVLGCAAKTTAGFIVLPFGLLQALIAMFYMHIGHCLMKHDWVRRAPAPVTVVCLVVWAVGLHFQFFYLEGTPPFDWLGIATTIAASWCVIQGCRLLEAHGGVVRDALSFVGINSLTVYEIHAVEALLIPWAGITINSLGPASPVVTGIMHFVFLGAILWLVAQAKPYKSMEKQKHK